jgi:hypothetical protein
VSDKTIILLAYIALPVDTVGRKQRPFLDSIFPICLAISEGFSCGNFTCSYNIYQKFLAGERNVGRIWKYLRTIKIRVNEK